MRTLSMAREVEQAQQNNMAIHIRQSSFIFEAKSNPGLG